MFLTGPGLHQTKISAGESSRLIHFQIRDSRTVSTAFYSSNIRSALVSPATDPFALASLISQTVFALRMARSNVRAAHFDLAVAHTDLKNRLRMDRRTFEHPPIVQ